MTYLTAAAAAVGVFVLATARRRSDLRERVGEYLRPRRSPQPSREPGIPLLQAGIGWSPKELAMRRLGAAGAGAVVGALLAQGDLLLRGSGASTPALVLLGAVTGLLLLNMAISTAKQQRARRLRFELPVVADAIALHVVAGESVASAIDRFVSSSGGVASEELGQAMDLHRGGADLAGTLTEIAKTTADPEATRLYAFLGQAHTTGGRLSSSLTELGADYRAALARDLTAEGGKRAIAGYGPVLVLMVPVALLFLLYPTLVGLRQLAGGP